jgi:hypothetical protein
MRESRLYGVVRGASSNGRFYRERAGGLTGTAAIQGDKLLKVVASARLSATGG